MGLPGDSIITWAQMQQAFNKKYSDYCRLKYTKEDIFRMTIGQDESLEDYWERFHLSYKRARCTLDPKSLKLVLPRGIREDILDTLNFLVGGDIYELPSKDINIVFRNHSRETMKKGMSSQSMASTSSSNSSIKGEIGNMLEDFKSEMLQTLTLQLDSMNIKISKRKQIEPWKWGREKGLIFFILVSSLVSLMGKALSILSLFPLSSWFSAIGLVGMGSSSCPSPIGSSNMSGFSPKGSSNSLSPRKREGWLLDVVGVFGKNFPELSLFLQGMKGNVFGFSIRFLFKDGKYSAERKLLIEWKQLTKRKILAELKLLNERLLTEGKLLAKWNCLLEWKTANKKETTCWIEILLAEWKRKQVNDKWKKETRLIL